MRYFQKQKKICPACGKTFEPFKRKQITCGNPDCKRLWRKIKFDPVHFEQRVCKFCGKAFTPHTSKQWTCGSYSCQRQREYEQKLERLANKADAKHRRYESIRETWINKKRNSNANGMAA